MLQLIKKIDDAWANRVILLGVNPNSCNGYFDFRNNVVIAYNKEEEVA